MDNYAGIITLYEDVEYHSDRRMDLLVPDTCTICYPVFAINFVVLKQQIGFRLNLYGLNCSDFIPPRSMNIEKLCFLASILNLTQTPISNCD